MTQYALFKGRIVPIEEAKISVMTHALNYGTACFEGIRAYWNEQEDQLFVFRMREHYDRFLESMGIMMMERRYTAEQLGRPFVVPVMVFKPDMADPAIRQKMKELQLWAGTGINASAFTATSDPWYERTGQGMGSTLTIADEKGAYTLSDDGTWYARESTLPYLGLLFSRNEDILRNRYSVIPVDPAAHPGVLFNEAVAFARWLVSLRGQGLIGAYAVGGHTIFTPDGNGTC